MPTTSKIRHPLRFVAVLALVVAGSVVPVVASEPDDPARVRKAIAFLDARQDDWFRYPGAKRGEGADRTTCVSCHSGVGFVLARAELGRFVGEPGPSAPARRLVATAGLRTDHWADLDSPRFRLMYDSDDRKKVESRGTEAVLNALILARGDGGERSTPSPASRAAFQRLWETQATEGVDAGSWDWLNFGLAPWEADGSRTFGAALAAIAVGSMTPEAPAAHGPADPTGPKIQALGDYLRRRFPRETVYNRLWILEAALSLEGLLTADQRREVVDQLLAAQGDDGGWSLSSLGRFDRVDGTPQARDSDGHATGLVVHALLRARTDPILPEVARGLAWLRTHQREDGSWPGRSVNKERDPTTFAGKLMTDAATAYAALALTMARPR